MRTLVGGVLVSIKRLIRRSRHLLEVLSLQAYLEWYREPTLSVKIDFEDDEINYLLDSCSIDEITEIIDNHDLDAIDIYADHRLDLSTIREILMMSIERNCFRRDSTYRYYLNTTINEKLMNINLKDKLRAHMFYLILYLAKFPP